MFKLLTKPLCQKLSKFSGYRQTDQLTDRPTDKPTPRSSDPELKNSLLLNGYTVWTFIIAPAPQEGMSKLIFD